MSKFYQTKRFKRLNAKWTKTLEQSGFDDIEHDEHSLTAYSSRFAKYPAYMWEIKEAYYKMCEEFLEHYKFKNEYERIIWEYHSNGLGVKTISRLLSEVGIKKERTGIWRRINKLQKLMKTLYLIPYDPPDEPTDE